MAQRKITVMHVLNFLSLAGLEYGVIKLVNRMPHDEFESVVCTLTGKQPGVEEVIDPRVRVVTLSKGSGIDLGTVRRLARLSRQVRPDIVHSHNWGAYVYTALARPLSRRGYFIHGEHGRDAAEQQLSLGQRLFIAATKRSVDRFTTVARHLADDVCRAWRVPREKIFVSQNGVDLDRFRVEEPRAAIRRSLGISETAPVIGTVASFRPVKDFATLFAAASRLTRRYPDLVVAIAGSHRRAEVVEQFQADAIARCAPARAVFLGSRKDIERVMRAFDVYVNSSRYEGMSNTILEAMASGCPVVASDVPGNREVLADGRFGNLFPVGHPQILAETIALLVDNAEVRERLVRDQLERVRKSFASEVTVDRYVRFYRAIVGKETNA